MTTEQDILDALPHYLDDDERAELEGVARDEGDDEADALALHWAENLLWAVWSAADPTEWTRVVHINNDDIDNAAEQLGIDDPEVGTLADLIRAVRQAEEGDNE